MLCSVSMLSIASVDAGDSVVSLLFIGSDDSVLCLLGLLCYIALSLGMALAYLQAACQSEAPLGLAWYVLMQ